MATSTADPRFISLGTRLTLLSCALFTLLTGASIAPALPLIRAHFADQADAELLTKIVLTVSPLFIAIGGVIAGWMIDRWRRRPILIVAIIGTALFGAAGAFMDSLWGLIICRALLGLCVAGVTNTCYTLMIDYFEGEERNRFLGLQAAVQKLGGLTFIVLGGVLAAISWRATFLVDLIALLVLPGVILAIREPDRTASRTERHMGLADLNWRVVPVVWAIGFFGQAAFFTIPTQLPFLLTTKLDAAPQAVGLIIAASTLASALTAIFYHRFRARLSHLAIFSLIALFVAVSFALVARADTVTSLVLAMAIGGFGLGLLLPNMTVWLMESTPVALRGRGIGIMMTAIFLGQFASPLLAQPLVQGGGIEALFSTMAVALGVAAGGFALAAYFMGARPASLPEPHL